MDDARVPTRRASQAERLIGRTTFGSRWLLAPFCLGLILGLVALLAKSALRVVDLVGHVLSGGGNEITVGILSLVDLSLMANLVLMVVFAGYESFVSRLDWMGQVGFGGLKLLALIVAILAIHVLEGFLDAGTKAAAPWPGWSASHGVRRLRRAARADGTALGPGPSGSARHPGRWRRKTAVEDTLCLMHSCPGRRRPNPDQPGKEEALLNVARAGLARP